MASNERQTRPRKLTRANLAAIAGRAAVPGYDRQRLAPAIVHIGVGGFHRAHQAVYLDDLAGQGVVNWAERGVGLLQADRRMLEALSPQDCLYTVVERDAGGDSARVIGSLTGYLYAPDDRARVLDLLADPATRIVSLTITEGGYNVDGHTGLFNAGDPANQADVHNPELPGTVFGYLCAALDRRASRRNAAVHRALVRQSAGQRNDRAHGGRFVCASARPPG